MRIYFSMSMHVYSFISRTAITLKVKMCLFLDEASYWAEKLLSGINLLPLMPDADNNFGGSLDLDLKEWWRHLQPIKGVLTLSKLLLVPHQMLSSPMLVSCTLDPFLTRPLSNNKVYLRASLCKILISSFARKIDFANNFFSVDFFS